jgi:hypothetical protein
MISTFVVVAFLLLGVASAQEVVEACTEELNGQLRLVKGNATAGIVELCSITTETSIFEWRSICDDFWTILGAQVVCRQLGHSPEGAVATIRSSFDDDEPVAYWLDDVMCTGNENSLLLCPHNGLESHNCGRNERAGVICQALERKRRQAQDMTQPRQPHYAFKCTGSESSLFECEQPESKCFGPHGDRPMHPGSNDTMGSDPMRPDRARKAIVRINGSGIEGEILFFQRDVFRVFVNLTGLTGEHNWHVHVNKSDPSCSSVGPHYDPTNASDTCNYQKDCERSPEECELGDLAGRFGTITDIDMPLYAMDTTEQLSLEDIIGLAVVIHEEGSTDIIVCGTIIEEPQCENETIRLVRGVTQSDKIGPLEVCINNEWERVIDHYWSDKDATVACRELFRNRIITAAVPIYFDDNRMDYPRTFCKNAGIICETES